MIVLTTDLSMLILARFKAPTFTPTQVTSTNFTRLLSSSPVSMRANPYNRSSSIHSTFSLWLQAAWGLSTISGILRNRRLSLFRPCCTFGPWSEVPANLDGDSHEGRKPSTRPPCRLRRTWLNLVKEDANTIPLSSLWRTEIFATVRQDYAKMMMRDGHS